METTLTVKTMHGSLRGIFSPVPVSRSPSAYGLFVAKPALVGWYWTEETATYILVQNPSWSLPGWLLVMTSGHGCCVLAMQWRGKLYSLPHLSLEESTLFWLLLVGVELYSFVAVMSLGQKTITKTCFLLHLS
ncbi:hypothetical protein BXZ70DRAFT_640778 [Cristinia sonorae]|uniref:Uncharacterized protein n=1 Tax=Cristinia sonorae TaxID=1940300 RepID=A0A8K0UFB8_9AGAR|nr:hypothetical protein BXZ70DRAFT_640778 [Cristinia sonorae]